MWTPDNAAPSSAEPEEENPRVAVPVDVHTRAPASPGAAPPLTGEGCKAPNVQAQH